MLLPCLNYIYDVNNALDYRVTFTLTSLWRKRKHSFIISISELLVIHPVKIAKPSFTSI